MKFILFQWCASWQYKVINRELCCEGTSSKISCLALNLSKVYQIQNVQVYALKSSHIDDEIDSFYKDINKLISISKYNFQIYKIIKIQSGNQWFWCQGQFILTRWYSCGKLWYRCYDRWERLIQLTENVIHAHHEHLL